MDTRLNELRNQIGSIDCEIVAALAQSRRSGNSPLTSTAPAGSALPTHDAVTLAARIQAEYARVAENPFPDRARCRNDAPAGKPADTAVVDAVRRRMRVSLEIARAKAKDMNAFEEEQAMRVIEGTARSMGIEVVG